MSSDSKGAPETELERLQAEGLRVLRDNPPAHPPLLFFVKPIFDWFEARLIQILRESGLPEARPAFNAVFIHLPADGCRLTELAARVDMTKQSMGELVEELVGLGYLARFPDPRDGRAKLILRTDKALALHGVTMQAFARIEAELVEMIGPEVVARLREAAATASTAIREA